jgi:predicted dehydrogenase
MADLRFGIIGAGNVGVGTSRGDSFMGLLAGLPGAAVTAIHDIAPGNAERAAKLAGAQPFSELEPFLESGLDAVVVCSPIIFHAEQSVAALERDIHVLSEVPAVHSTEAARQLASAAARSNGHYMLAENYCYLDEIELVRRLARDGRFGEVYFAEGEYVHDCRDLWVDAEGKPTWRGLGKNAVGPGVYCTHSLGPLLFILQDRVVQVSALANESNLVAEGRPGSFNFIMLMRTAGGRTLKVRVDTVSPRPHQAAYYSLQGTAGAYESWRGLEDEPKIWLSDEHEESHCFESAAWHPLMTYASRYIPERLAVGDEARAGGHGTSEYWMVREFIAAIQRDEPPPIGVHEGLDYTLPGISAVESASAGGEDVTVPDPRGM